jgi:hypothetical protein
MKLTERETPTPVSRNSRNFRVWQEIPCYINSKSNFEKQDLRATSPIRKWQAQILMISEVANLK